MRFVKRFRPNPPPADLGVDPSCLAPLGGGVDGGGKAAGLARLQAAGLPIPPTAVVPVQHHRAHAVTGEVPPSVRDAWVRGARRLGARLAVRSSAVAEDGRRRSFAGVHTTVLGVAPEGVPEAVQRVWASATSDRARAYGGGGGMAVVVQPLLEPDAAGVVFTVNPRTGSWRELVIEAVAGQGEALVSGRQAPQWVVIRRGRRLRVVDRDDVPQRTVWRVGSNGALLGQPAAAGQALLDDRAALALARLALAAERAFGQPVDVEWARVDGRFVLLQARPVTRSGRERPRDVLWTRRFLGERMPRPPTPMTWSILEPLLAHFIAYPKVQAELLGGGPALRTHRGHAYVNATIFRHLVFKWPGTPAPGFLLELLPPEEADAIRRSFRVRADGAVYRAILRDTLRERRWRRFVFDPLRNPARWDAFERALPERLDALERPLLGTADGLGRVDAYVGLLRDYLAIHVCSLLYANLGYQLLEASLRAVAPDRASPWMEALATSPPGNRTLELNHALGDLAARATAADRARLAAGRAEGPFAALLDDFLARYGDRAEASWEVFSPRWRDDPARLAPLLEAPGGAVSTRTDRAASALEELRRRRPGPVGAAVEQLVHQTRRYLLLRENQRFAFDRITAGLQRRLLELGAHAGVPATSLPWWTLDELRGWIDGGLDTPPPVEARRRAHTAAPVDPPVFLRGDAPADRPVGGRRLEGLGISAGRVRGRVRIARTLAEGAALRAGEVLVAPAVDPGWTPLLTRAGGMVLELGSLLSHGAVIAREYGLPAVVNLAGVTRALRDGDEVTVDGRLGVVWVHDSGAGPDTGVA